MVDYEEELDRYLDEIKELARSKQYARLRDLFLPMEPADIALLLEESGGELMPLLYRLLPKELAAEVFVELESDSQEMLINGFSNTELKEVLDELYLDDAVDIVEEMPASVVIRILDKATPEMRKSINEILKYPEDSTGSIMNMEFLSLKKDMTVEDALKRIRRTGPDKETINVCYVIDDWRHLIGVLSIRTLLLAEEDDIIGDIMERNYICVQTLDDQEETARALGKYDFLALPVVDTENRLVGIVTVDDAIDVLQEETTEDMEKMAAMLPTDKPYLRTSAFDTFKSRIPWLLLLMVSATFTGQIISSFEDALSAFTILTAYIPMLMDTGGNCGSQASVTVIRGLSLARNEKSLYDFGLEIATRSGIIAAYRTENTPEATSALDNIEELLNSMQLFNEQREAEIRAGERQQEERATIEEWLQGVMLMTDMDKDDPQDRNKVTLMTVHSAKGLEYKFVYIVGLEENLFPSQRAVESPDGFEEERRLFYVALTRAKELATLSYAEMRFKWGNMEFSRPSCFLREIDSRYLETDAMQEEREPVRRSAGRGEGSSALDELRRRFDYRYQQKPAAGGSQAGARFGGGSSAGVKSEAQRPVVVQPTRSTAGMRSVGVRQGESSLVEGAAPVSCGDYAVGDRVSHLKFGAGVIRRIETLASDHKLVVEFSGYGEKTLLAKFAKLTKL